MVFDSSSNRAHHSQSPRKGQRQKKKKKREPPSVPFRFGIAAAGFPRSFPRAVRAALRPTKGNARPSFEVISHVDSAMASPPPYW
mmetsp:Transcript_38028/g.113570  ORF Transcript_38028/g.113570 Transcript_38028/m.113570 type:complete len:85 (+) Transcript_38028:787-1041(+)